MQIMWRSTNKVPGARHVKELASNLVKDSTQMEFARGAICVEFGEGSDPNGVDQDIVAGAMCVSYPPTLEVNRLSIASILNPT